VSARAETVIHIGGVSASRAPALIKTMVGSCIAACLIDPAARVAGMNHFMLPAPKSREDPMDRARFGVHAMDLLMGAVHKAGGDRRRLVAKIFGGAHVLRLERTVTSVPQQNIRFIEEFLAAESIPIVGWDVGGDLPRQVHLETDTGTVYVKRLAPSIVRQTGLRERRHLSEMRRTTARIGAVTMFASR
jgi:chemotaxis protein CheD